LSKKEDIAKKKLGLNVALNNTSVAAASGVLVKEGIQAVLHNKS
jgi:hypothetical protein